VDGSFPFLVIADRPASEASQIGKGGRKLDVVPNVTRVNSIRQLDGSMCYLN
jgi:hypothetical protein